MFGQDYGNQQLKIRSYFNSAFYYLIAMLTISLSASICLGQTKTIYIDVVDPRSDYIVGARVALTAEDDTVTEKLTDEKGRAIFTAVEAKSYRVIVEAVGFQKYESDSFLLGDEEKKVVEIELKPTPVIEKVEVEDEREFEDATVLNEDDISKLPDDHRLLRMVLEEMAGDSIDGTAIPIIVDGFESAELPPKELIKEIRFDRNIFSAQYEGTHGGGIQVYSKSDVKRMSYGINFGFSDAIFNAADPYVEQKLPAQNRSLRGFVYGPLFSDRRSILLELGHSDNKSGAAINAIGLDSDLQEEAIKQGFDTSNESNSIGFTSKGDIGEKHGVYLRYSFQNSSSEGGGVGGFSLPSVANIGKTSSNDLRISENYFASEKIFAMLRFQFRNNRRETKAINSNEPKIVVAEAFTGGGGQANGSRSTNRSYVYSDTLFTLGKHELRFGGHLRYKGMNENSKSNFGGTYTFEGRNAVQLDSRNNPILESGQMIYSPISSLEAYRRTLLFAQNGLSASEIRNLGGGASQFSIAGGVSDFSRSQFDYAFYIQDNFRLSKAAFLSVGLRYENQTNINSPLNFAPRIGIAWNPKKKDDTPSILTLPRIQSGFGVFYSRFDVQNLLFVDRSNADGRLAFFVTESNGITALDSFPALPSIDILEATDTRITRSISPDIKTPLSLIYSFQMTKKLFGGFSTSFRFQRTISRRKAVTRNIGIDADAGRGFSYITDSIGKRRHNWIVVNLNIPRTSRVFSSMSYSYHRSKDDAVSASGNPFDANDFSQEYGAGTLDGSHSIIAHVGVEAFWGIYFSTSFSFGTGNRFNIVTGQDTNGDGYLAERPSYASNPMQEGVVETKYGILNPNPTATEELIPRNLGRAGARYNMDLYISKRFQFNKNKSRQYGLNLSVFIRNLLNANYPGTPVGNMSSPNFLKEVAFGTSGDIDIINGVTYTGASPRTMNFSINFNF